MERFTFTPEQPEERRTPNEAQENSLIWLCRRYGVEYSAEDYMVYSPDDSMMAGYAVGWVGGNEQAERTIYVGVSPDGRVNS